MASHWTCAVQRADYENVTVGDEHDMWVSYVPYMVNSNGDAVYLHGQRTVAARTVGQPLITTIMSAEIYIICRALLINQ